VLDFCAGIIFGWLGFIFPNPKSVVHYALTSLFAAMIASLMVRMYVMWIWMFFN